MNFLCEAARSGGSYVWNRQRHLERVSARAYPVPLPLPSFPPSVRCTHIRATTWLLTVTTHMARLPRQWGAVHPCSQTPLSLSAASLSGRTSWTLGVTMLAKRNGHDPPPQHSRSRPPESPLGVARVGRGVLFRGPNVRSGSYSRTWRFFLRSFLVQSTGQFG